MRKMQTLENINFGQAPNDGTGDELRTAFQKTHTNFGRIAEGVEAVEEAAAAAGQLAGEALPAAEKGVADGVAPLNGQRRVPAEYLPDEFIPMVQKGAADGVATLGADGKVTPEQLPNAVDAIPLAEKGRPGGVATLDEAGHVHGAQLDLAVLKEQKGAANGVAPLDPDSRLSTANLPAVTQSLWDGIKLNMSPGGRWVEGNFDGLHAADTTSVRNSRVGDTSTYLPIVPPVGGNSAFVICRNTAGTNSSFVALGMSGTNLFADLTFSRHGTAGIPGALRIFSANTECGRIGADGSWIFGPYLYTPNVQARTHIYYAGGGSQYGMVFRPQLFADGLAIQFQAYNGAVAGAIQSNSNLSTSYLTTSDYRSKDLLGVMDSAVALDNVMTLRPVYFRMKGAAVVTLPLNGFVAHELQEVIPQAVTGRKDETRDEDGNAVPVMQGVDMSKIVPTLVAAIQAQQRLIEELTRRVELLDGNSARVLPE